MSENDKSANMNVAIAAFDLAVSTADKLSRIKRWAANNFGGEP